MYYPADPGKSSWLITATRHGASFELKIELLMHRKNTNIKQWQKIIAGAYDPAIYYEPQWMYQGKSVLLLQYQLGADWTILTVIGLDVNSPIILQQLDGGLFDMTYATSVDGNGDLRLRDTSEPFGFHCYKWVSASSTFSEHACKTLKEPNLGNTH